MNALCLLVATLAVILGVFNLRFSMALAARLQQGYAPAAPPRRGEILELGAVGARVEKRTIVVAGEATCLACKGVAQEATSVAKETGLSVAFVWADRGPAQVPGAKDVGWYIDQRQLLTTTGITTFPFVLLVEPDGTVAHSGPATTGRQLRDAVDSAWPPTLPTLDVSETRP